MTELKAKNFTWAECKKTARNRTRWKALVEDGMFHLGTKTAKRETL